MSPRPRARSSYAACVAALVALAPARAEAQDGLAGAVQGHFLASPDGDYGAALSADLWLAIGMFRVGGFFGVGAVPSETDAQNRAFMPLGASLGLEILGADVGLSLRLRGGMWGGATQAVKLTAGGFAGGGASLLVRLGEGATASIGLDVWGLFGDGETALFSPTIGLTWAPAAPPPFEPPAHDSNAEASAEEAP